MENQGGGSMVTGADAEKLIALILKNRQAANLQMLAEGRDRAASDKASDEALREALAFVYSLVVKP